MISTFDFSALSGHTSTGIKRANGLRSSKAQGTNVRGVGAFFRYLLVFRFMLHELSRLNFKNLYDNFPRTFNRKIYVILLMYGTF